MWNEPKSEESRNKLAYTICSDADEILHENYADCVKLSKTVKKVHGSHSTIENVGQHLADMLAEIEKDRLLLFLGRGSAFADEHNSAFFVEDNELVLIDCPATS